MKSSCNREDTTRKNAYHRTGTTECLKTSVVANQYKQPWQQQRNESNRIDVPIDKFDKTSLKTFENIIHHSIQPCPFTILTAVKRKLALDRNPSNKKVYEPQVSKNTMEFVKPLKVPDLKISPKMDYSSRESLLSSEELAKKIEAAHRDEMAMKNTRKQLEFSSSSTTSINVEPLKIPDFSISKKKDLSRDNSREKENKSKKIKKDDQNKNDFQDLSKWAKSQRHISRKEIADAIINRKLKENDAPKKSVKSKNFMTSTAKKDDDKRQKSKESRTKTSSSESVCPLDKGTRLHEKILIKEGYKAMISEMGNSAKQKKSKPINLLTRDQKKLVDKQKSKYSSEISEDLTTAATSISEKISEKTFQSSNNRNKEDSISTAVSENVSKVSTNIETNISQDVSISEKLMDSMRISFRDDSYSNQPEFADLVTPDINLMVKSKRRKHVIQDRDSDHDFKESKQFSSQDTDDILKMQTRDINLLDSFCESFRQTIDTEKSKISGDDMKKQSDNKSTDSIRTELDSAESKIEKSLIQKPPVKVAEVQTQTANDIATQTETTSCQRGNNASLGYSRESLADTNEDFHLSLNSEDRYEDMDRVEDISLHNRMRTMSEISLHETTSSIKTETGTEISISTRDVTCSFNKYLDLEMAQLIKDERQRYDKIEMLFKSREKTLNDRTKKLVKLEEQKRVLRDTGQDSRISSVKKKQRALLLKLQQEKDEMNRLKELHKIASQERKLMLQKQRDMFNPEMSTKNILNKLKRSADSQSPRRLSGPMRGYDIRSNSSISSLVDSDRSQLDHSQLDFKLNLSDITLQKNDQQCSRFELDSSLKQGLYKIDNIDKKLLKIEANKQQKEAAAVAKLKYDLKTKKFEEKMPKADLIRLKSHQYDLDTILKHGATVTNLSKSENLAYSSHDEDAKSVSERVKTESDALIEEFTQIWRSQFPDLNADSLTLNEATDALEAIKEIQRESNSKRQLCKEALKRSQQQNLTKRKGAKQQKSTSKSENSEAFRHITKRTKIDNNDQHSDEVYENSILEELDFNESQSSLQALLKHSNLLKERNDQLLKDIVDERRNVGADNSESPLSQKDEEMPRGGNTSSRSQVSLTISHQSSNDSDRSYSRSVVIRSQQDHHHSHPNIKTSKKLEQILRAREATLVSRRNCVEEWIAWHARLREEENRVARMEQAAYKLVSATANALSHNDTTVSSDTSDVEGRIEQLTQKLADRRLEMARLKKEARKQAKQRLRALEANLLNQIKKYDVTINDMRKKLESRRVPSRESDRLAIESKSVIDFKVPEIPIKKIQEIYKSSDLLRSKSESDIITDITSKNVKPKSNDAEKDTSQSKSSDYSKPSSVLYTVYDEDHELSEKSEHSNKTKSNSEEIATQRSIYTDLQDMRRSSSQSSNISEEIPSEAYSAKISGVQSNKDLKNSSNIEEELAPSLDDTSIIFSKKLDHIQLHNKELNDDIRNLENDLKELTEMVSNFKKSDDKSMKDSSKEFEKSTSKDLTEDLPETDNIDEDLQNRVQKILSDVISETDDLITSVEDFDAKRSRSNDKESEEIATYLSSHRDLKSNTNQLHSVTEVITTYMEDDKENVSPNKSQKSTNFSISNQVDSELEKINQIQEFDTEIIEEQIISPKIYEEINAEDEVQTVTKISTVEEAIEDQHGSRISTYKEITEDQHIETRISSTGNQHTETRISTPEEVTEDKHLDTEILTGEDITANQQIQTKVSTFEDISEIRHIESQISTPEEISGKKRSGEEMSAPEELTNDQQIETEVSTSEEIIGDQHEKSKDTTSEDISGNKQLGKVISTPETITQNQPSKTEDKILKEEESVEHNIDANTENDDNLVVIDKSMKENTEIDNPFVKSLESDHDWTLSDSFEIQQISDKNSKSIDFQVDEKDRNGISLMEDSTMFIPKGESTNLQDTFVLKIDESSDPKIGIRSDEFNDILEIIERETKNDDERQPEPAILNLQNCETPIDVSIAAKTTNELSESIEEEIEMKDEGSIAKDQPSVKDVQNFPQIVNDLKIQVIDETNIVEDRTNDKIGEKTIDKIELIKKSVEEIKSVEKVADEDDRGSSEGEQMDNLIEIAEGSLETLEKLTPSKGEKTKTHTTVFLDKTFEVIKDPGYEDISEESLDVSGIQDKSVGQKSKKFTTVPEKYIIKSKSDEVLRILDELSNNYKAEKPEEIVSNVEEARKIVENKSESSEGLDTPRGVSEIELDSPREVNEDSRLDVDNLDDDLLTGNSLLQTQAIEEKIEFRTTPMGATSEKDIQAMIDKLKATLGQPGLEVAELEATLLQIENLQIELAIKKLEAEEVSYYLREIPNKPPPPYTPPGTGRLSSTQSSPSPPPVVIPTNIEELTVFTEKVTSIIYQAKQTGEDILSLEAPIEICELAKDNSSESLKKDRRIYNTFLFDLCKELVAEIYKTEQENPGPSWTKPSVKTKPVVKVPKNLDELNDYVSKEAATLFGFKTKLQRENMVMRWSRKRRDRVDELLAKEAQAEEKEWTKFHHDELAVKNELTVTILDSIITETTNCIKAVYAKKRKTTIR